MNRLAERLAQKRGFTSGPLVSRIRTPILLIKEIYNDSGR